MSKVCTAAVYVSILLWNFLRDQVAAAQARHGPTGSESTTTYCSIHFKFTLQVEYMRIKYPRVRSHSQILRIRNSHVVIHGDQMTSVTFKFATCCESRRHRSCHHTSIPWTASPQTRHKTLAYLHHGLQTFNIHLPRYCRSRLAQ